MIDEVNPKQKEEVVTIFKEDVIDGKNRIKLLFRRFSFTSNFKDIEAMLDSIGKAIGDVVKGSRIGRNTSGIDSREEDKERYWKRILIIDDEADIITTLKLGIESASETSRRRIVVDTYSDSRIALLDFEPNLYDLALIDINMPYIDGFRLSEKILGVDLNVKICFMSSGEINRDALREIHPSISLGCFIKKPVMIDYLVDRIVQELD